MQTITTTSTRTLFIDEEAMTSHIYYRASDGTLHRIDEEEETSQEVSDDEGLDLDTFTAAEVARVALAGLTDDEVNIECAEGFEAILKIVDAIEAAPVAYACTQGHAPGWIVTHTCKLSLAECCKVASLKTKRGDMVDFRRATRRFYSAFLRTPEVCVVINAEGVADIDQAALDGWEIH